MSGPGLQNLGTEHQVLEVIRVDDTGAGSVGLALALLAQVFTLEDGDDRRVDLRINTQAIKSWNLKNA
jgi:hypothetical protein